MSVTVSNPVRIAANLWRVDFSSTLPDAVFRAFVGGRLFYEGARAYVTVRSVCPPYVDVLDDDARSVQQTYPVRLSLSWLASDDAAFYSVRRDTGSGYAEVGRVRDDGRSYFLWLSPVLDDGLAVAYRVVPVSSNGDEGTGVDFDATTVRIPDAPDVALAYTGGEVVIDHA